jgi:flagellar motor switch protein FliN/FliY
MPDEKDLNQSENQPDLQPSDQPSDGQAQDESAPANVTSSEDEIPDGFVAAGDGPQASRVVNDGDASEEDAEEEMLKMLNDLPQDDTSVSAEDIDFGQSDEVSKAEFQNLQQPAGSHDPQNIDLLMDVDLPVSIELGRTRMSISDILSLGPGSVVELNKLAGEPVDLLVNNKQVARGEVVVVDENFGLRITQLMTPEERLKSLGRD